MLFVVYVDIIGNVAVQYAATDIMDEYNVIGIVDHPMRTLMHGLILQAKPLNLDTLQLFVVLMAVFPLSFVVHAAAAEPHARRFDRALRRCARVRLEPACLSYGQLVFQSVLLAAPLRAWRLVRRRTARS